MGILEGKVALITGASDGIGYTSAKLFAREGAAVVAVARRQDRLAALVNDIEKAGGQAACLAGDVRDEHCARNAVALAVERFGGLDIGFNNAGTMGALGSIPDITVDGWQETLDVNLTGAFLSARHQIPELLKRRGASLIFTSTFVGPRLGLPGMAAYAAAKAGLVGLMHVLAAEYGPQGRAPPSRNGSGRPCARSPWVPHSATPPLPPASAPLGPYAPWPVHAPPTGWPWPCPATAWCARMAPCPAIAGASSASASCCAGKRHWLMSKRMAQVASKPLSTDRGPPPSHYFDFPGLPGSVSSGSAPPAIAHRYRLAVLP